MCDSFISYTVPHAWIRPFCDLNFKLLHLDTHISAAIPPYLTHPSSREETATYQPF